MSAPGLWMARDVDPAQVLRAMRDQGEWSDQGVDDANIAILCYRELVKTARELRQHVVFDEEGDLTSREFENMLARFDAAIARCKGE